MQCRSCGTEVPAAASACPSCGTLFPALSVDAFEAADLDRTPVLPADLPGDLAAEAPTVRRPAGEEAAEVGRGPPESEESRFLFGTLLAGRFRIARLLGKGAMGEVYRADDLKLGLPVALKFLPEALEQDEAQTSRFLDEVKIARQVSHPNVCRVFDVGEVDGHLFLSMEYIGGEDLASLLRRIGRLPQDKAAELGRELALGLAAIHRAGVLHRDLKPANLMLDGRGRARITDFGIAGLATKIEGAEAGAGTPAYMAPEQLAGMVSVKSDLYALGLVLYELFTGQRAYEASSLQELVQQRESAPVPPSSLVEGLDPAVERVILRCLETDPRDRPSSAAAVAAVFADSETGTATEREPVQAAELWNVPFERNPFFTGRDDVLEEIREMLTRAAPRCRPLTIHGLGGIGKTQTAVEYAYRFREHYDAVFWVAAETVDDLETGYVEIARRLDLPQHDAGERSASVRAVLRWLETTASWLLILDNADTPRDLRGRLPAEHQGHVILTSRARSFGRLARPLRLSTLSPARAEAFLLKRAQRVEVSDAEQEAVAELARELGYLPLALEQAGAYLEDTGTAFQTYLSGFRRRRLKLLDEATAPEEHPPVATTWEMNFAEIEKTSAASADLLRVCAFLAPDSIPVELLEQGAPELGPALAAALENAAEDELRLDEILRPARRYSLIQRDAEARTFSIHRLVQEAVKARMDEDTRRRWGRRVVHAVARVFPEVRALDSRNWHRAERLFPQGRAAVRLVDRWALESSEASLLLNRLGICAGFEALYEEAESMCRRALAMRRRQPAAEPSRIVESLLSLAMVLNMKGAHEEIETLCREVLAISRSQTGAESRDVVAASLFQMGMGLLNARAYEQAGRRLREVLTLLRREVGDERPLMAHSLYFLGFISFSEGVSLQEAEQSLREASAISRRLALPLWPWYQSTLVSLLCLQGDFAEAEPLGREALAAVRQLDDELPGGGRTEMPGSHVIWSLHYLARAMSYQGRYREAERLIREALAVHRRQPGDEHWIVAFDKSRLARLFVLEGIHAEAERFGQEALAISQRLGDEHPASAYCLTTLALLRGAQERYVVAEELLRQALKIQRRILPPDSLWIARDEVFLGDALAGQERYEEAETLLVESLRVVRGRAGDRSLFTRLALESLVKLYESWGKAKEAAEYRVQCGYNTRPPLPAKPGQA